VKNPVARLLATTLLAVLGTVGLTTLGATSASAHDSIVGSDPADGAELTGSPTQVVLSFSAEIQAVGNQVVVSDAAGTEVASGEPVADGSTATLPLPTLADGEYTVTWRVVSSDGHPIDGTFGFTVADPSPDATPAPEMTALEQPDAEASPEVTEGPAVDSDTEVLADGSEQGGLPWVGIIVAGVLGLVAGTVLVVRNKRRSRED